MSLVLDQSAIVEIKRVQSETPDTENMWLRIGVKGGGCSGFEYKMGFVEPEDYDEKVEKKSAPFLEGVTVRWHEDLMKRGFVFDNPNASRSCGCGKSFSV